MVWPSHCHGAGDWRSLASVSYTVQLLRCSGLPGCRNCRGNDLHCGVGTQNDASLAVASVRKNLVVVVAGTQKEQPTLVFLSFALISIHGGNSGYLPRPILRTVLSAVTCLTGNLQFKCINDWDFFLRWSWFLNNFNHRIDFHRKLKAFCLKCQPPSMLRCLERLADTKKTKNAQKISFDKFQTAEDICTTLIMFWFLKYWVLFCNEVSQKSSVASNFVSINQMISSQRILRNATPLKAYFASIKFLNANTLPCG